MPTAASTMPNLMGSTINDRYALIELLGSGTFGVVYKAVDTKCRTGRRADCFRAIKLVNKAGRKDSQLASVRREIALHMRASHLKNVVTLHDAYEDDDYFILIMDFCGGGDLSDYLEKHGPYTNESKLRKMFLAIIDAVEALHAVGIFHRDLKPANILLSEDGSKVYLADFGLASNQDISRSRCGTPAYMSPEVIDLRHEHRPISGSCSDVWALGVILLNMLSGCTPWLRATASMKNYVEFVDKPQYLLGALPISEGLNKIVRRMLRTDPRIRIHLSDARRAIADLDVVFRDTRVPVRPPREEPGWEAVRSTLASELALKRCCAPNVTGCGLGFSTTGLSMDSTRATPGTSRRNTPESSAKSSMIATPGDSVVLPRDVDNQKKDAVGERLKAIVSRLKIRL